MSVVYYFDIREGWDIDTVWLWAQQYGAWLTARPGHVHYTVVGMDEGVRATELALRFADYISSVRRVEW